MVDSYFQYSLHPENEDLAVIYEVLGRQNKLKLLDFRFLLLYLNSNIFPHNASVLTTKNHSYENPY